MVHTDVLADTSLHQDNISECMISLAIKLSCNSRREREQGGRMTADYLMEMLRNTNQVQLPLQPLWYAQFSQYSKKKNKSKHITRRESNEDKLD